MRIALRAGLLTLTLLVAFSAPANALELIFGNQSLGNAGQTFGPTSSVQYKQIAQGFTMGSTSYQLFSAYIGLNLTAPIPTTSEISVSLFNDSGSNTPGSLIGSFDTSTPYVNGAPSSLAVGRTAYEFLYTGTGAAATLTSGAKYWIVMENIPGVTPIFDWSYASGLPSDDPVQINNSGVSYLATLGTRNGDATNWTRNLSVSNSNLRFNIAVVPEPSTYALGIAGTLVMGAVARRKSRKTAST